MKEYIKKLVTPIAIIGMGKSGESALRLLRLMGIPESEIFTFDGKPNKAKYHDPASLFSEVNPKTLIVSPGYPLKSPWIQAARKNGVAITSELSLACMNLSTEKLVGVTGSIGKSTTVSILGAALLSIDSHAFVGGNLGTPFSEYVAEVLEGKRQKASWVVLELSSYQLENCEQLKLDASIITYLSANHLERYSSLEEYYQTKLKIIECTHGPCFVNKAGGDLLPYLQKNSTAHYRVVSKADEALKKFKLQESLLIGEHNQDNLALAATVISSLGLSDQSIHAMKNFQGLEHRLENLGYISEIRFINDSKATSMDSVITAVKAAELSCKPGSKLFVLLGGRDKNLPWGQLSGLSQLPNIGFVFFGECRELAASAAGLPGSSYGTLKEALALTFKRLTPGDTLLLAPGGTSLDEFSSFEERGNFFKTEVIRNFKT